MQEHLQMKQPIVIALTNSFLADQQKLKQATHYLMQLSSTPGYCMTLMQIVDDVNINQAVKQAALIQLKNTIKKHWKATKKVEISPQQKQQIKQILVVAMIRCSKSYKLIKLYKQIITLIISHQYKNWIPIEPILTKIRSDQDLIPMLQLLIAIATSFQFSITQQQRNFFFQFLKAILPELNALRQRNTNSQLIYLITKFLWKAVHYEISDQIKKLTTQWMDLIALIVGLSNPQYDNNIDQPQNKGTPEFYYFHSKKWATRILLRFIQKHAKSNYIKKNQNKQFSQYWYNNFGQKFVQILIHQFNVTTTKKVRYFQLKCIQSLVSQKPNQIKQFAALFQESILVNFMKLQPQDQQIAQNDPIQFLTKQAEPSINFSNLKRVATDVWVAFAELGNQPYKKNSPYKPGIFFYDNMKYLKSKLQGNNLIQKQLAMYLICELRSPIMKCNIIKAELPNWIANYIIPQFVNQVMFLRARAVDIFFQYGSIENLPYPVIEKATQGIYKCFTNDNYPLVRIKAANTFNVILRHKEAKNLVRPLLKDILAIYLQLLEKYDLQSVVNSLQSIVQGFSDQIGPFAAQLGKYLSKLFIKMFKKDVQQCNNDDYDGQAQLAAAGCLKTFTQIIDSPITQQSIIALEPQVISLCEFIFSAQTIDYIQDILVLLNSYLHKIQNISPNIWFYYQVIVYNIVGVPKTLWSHIQNLPISQTQKAILENIKENQNVQMMQQSMPVLRNFIRKGSNIILENQDAFKTNLLQLLFYLVNQIYKKGPNEFTGQVQMMCSTALIIYLVQNNKNKLPEPIYYLMLSICKYNTLKIKSKTLKVLNSQLLSLLLWIHPALVLSYVEKQNFGQQFMKQLLSYESKYQEQYQKQRMILGLSSLMKHPNKPQFVLNRFPDLFKTLVKIVKSNSQERINDQIMKKNNVQANLQDFDQDDEQDLDNIDITSDDDDQQFWEQQYDDNYDSPLDSIDQILYFEQCIQQVKQQQNQFYNQMIKIISVQDLAHLSSVVQKAKNYLYAKAVPLTQK